MGPTPCYSLSQVVSACQSFRPAAPFFFSGIAPQFKKKKEHKLSDGGCLDMAEML